MPPKASTAVTKSRLRSDSTCARVTRAKLGMPVMPTATSAAAWLRPRTAISAMAKQDARAGQQHVDDAHQQRVAPAAEEAGDEADRHADQRRDRNRAGRGQQRGPRAVDARGPKCRGRARRCRTSAPREGPSSIARDVLAQRVDGERTREECRGETRSEKEQARPGGAIHAAAEICWRALMTGPTLPAAPPAKRSRRGPPGPA